MCEKRSSALQGATLQYFTANSCGFKGLHTHTNPAKELAPTKTDCSVFKCSFYQKMRGDASKTTADSKLTANSHVRSAPAMAGNSK